MEEYSIEFLRTARKALAKLPIEIQERIAARINELKTNPYPPDVKALKNGGGRLRKARGRLSSNLSNRSRPPRHCYCKSWAQEKHL